MFGERLRGYIPQVEESGSKLTIVGYVIAATVLIGIYLDVQGLQKPLENTSDPNQTGENDTSSVTSDCRYTTILNEGDTLYGVVRKAPDELGINLTDELIVTSPDGSLVRKGDIYFFDQKEQRDLSVIGSRVCIPAQN